MLKIISYIIGLIITAFLLLQGVFYYKLLVTILGYFACVLISLLLLFILKKLKVQFNYCNIIFFIFYSLINCVIIILNHLKIMTVDQTIFYYPAYFTIYIFKSLIKKEGRNDNANQKI